MKCTIRYGIMATVALAGLLLPLTFAESASAVRLNQPPSSGPAPLPAQNYSLDGTGNNANNPQWGAAGTAMIRRAAAAYADGISSPAGTTRPSARAISNLLSAQDDSVVNNRHLSDFIYVWGQFLDHDINLTSVGSEGFSITVLSGDASFDPDGTGVVTMRFARSLSASGTGTSQSNPREQMDGVSAYIDASMVYGSVATRAAALRTFTNGELRTSAGDMMPYNTTGLANANDARVLPDDELFLGGDIRANENPDLIAIQTLFLREHNRIARTTKQAHSTWTDEKIFQTARGRVIAEIQSITYNEYLPALLGRDALTPYRGYQATTNPAITNEFATAAFRFGHSVLDSEIARLDDDGSEVPAGSLTLRESFFNAAVFDPTLPNHEGDIDPFLKSAASGNAQEVDLLLIDDIRNFLFGAPGQGGFDLAALNIQRGRDHGLADYNTTRVAYGLPRVRTFSDITTDRATQEKLKTLYGSVDNIDLWVGGLAEDHAPGSSVGSLFQRIIVDQFMRIRGGDRNWYENTFAGPELGQLRGTHFSDVIRRNTGLRTLQNNVFVWDESVDKTNRLSPPSVVAPRHP
ncbi:MAG: peroxidase [Actinobacteria bacterium]|nr:peroxidase [Actinomycetota bacterium]